MKSTHASGIALSALVSACAAGAPQVASSPQATTALAAPVHLVALAEAIPGLAGPFPLASCVTPTPVTPSPSEDAPGYGCETTIVSGIVYGPDGQPADGAAVVARSLDASVPYTATATTFQGNWVINSIPGGARMEIYAVMADWMTPRTVGQYFCQAKVVYKIELRAEPNFPPLDAPSASP